MPALTVRTTSGREATLARADVDRLAAELRGELLTPDAAGYDDARRIWNAMVDRRPAMVARCRGPADVVAAVRFARAHDLLVTARGGGHNIAGNALADGGLVVDLTPMRAVRVDPAGRTARVEPGATLAEFDAAVQAHGLATPVGINSTTGIAGLTLGGGYGWLSRRHGLTVDNLLAADVVTADGELVTASERERADLFWALRGGGGNFGIVTAFDFRLHPVGPEVVAGLIVHPFDDAARLLRAYRDAAKRAPDELTAWVVLRQAPPLPFLAPEVHGQRVMVIAVMWSGDPARADEALAPLRAIGTPHADVVGPSPYTGFQAAFDPLLAPGSRNYWKTHNFADLHDGLIDVLVARLGELPGPQCEIFVAHLGGAVRRVPEDATAYAGRDAEFVMNVHARWDDAAEDARHVAWARATYEATAPFAGGGAYVNFLTGDEGERVRSAYGANYDRLAALKAKYDPTNLFRVNQNVQPMAAVATPASMPSPAGGVPRPQP